MKEYKSLVRRVLKNGQKTQNRTNIDTISVFGEHIRFKDVWKNGLPILTTKKVAFKSVVAELLWFLEGSTDERRLAEILYEKPREELIGKPTIWTLNADNQGKALGYENSDLKKELGRIYGYQWNKGNNLQNVIQEIKDNPLSRRLLVSAWNSEDLPKMALPPCHTHFQFNVKDGFLDLIFYMRSVDVFLGLPFNITSYAVLQQLVAQECGLKPRDLLGFFGDTHIYENHFKQTQELLSRKPYKRPFLEISDKTKVSGFKLINYKSHPAISAEMAI